MVNGWETRTVDWFLPIGQCGSDHDQSWLTNLLEEMAVCAGGHAVTPCMPCQSCDISYSCRAAQRFLCLIDRWGWYEGFLLALTSGWHRRIIDAQNQQNYASHSNYGNLPSSRHCGVMLKPINRDEGAAFVLYMRMFRFCNYAIHGIDVLHCAAEKIYGHLHLLVRTRRCWMCGWLNAKHWAMCI